MNEKGDDRRVRKTKKALRQSLAILLSQKDIKDISVRELTDLADLHRGTFYLHYKDIYDLQKQIEDEMFAEVTGILNRYPPGENPFPMVLSLVQYLGENAATCRMLLGGGDMAFVNQLSDLVGDKCLQDWLALYRGSDRQAYEFCRAYVVSGCIGILRHWMEGDMQQSPECIASYIEKLSSHGVAFLREENAAGDSR